MSTSDKNLPISIAFHELVGKAQDADTADQERRYKLEQEARQKLFAAQHPGKLTASQAFLPNEEENERLKSQIDAELKTQAAAKRAAQEKADASPTGEFPPPPTGE